MFNFSIWRLFISFTLFFFLQSLINKKIIRKWSPWSELFKYLLIFRIWKTRHLLFIFESEQKMHLFSLLLSFAQLYVHYFHARIQWKTKTRNIILSMRSNDLLLNLIFYFNTHTVCCLKVTYFHLFCYMASLQYYATLTPICNINPNPNLPKNRALLK